MANPLRGEIDAELDGATYTLRLTLGALAELEHQLAAGDILALVARISSGKLRAKECIAIVGAGLRAAGYDVSDAQVARMTTPNGAAGFIDIVARLLTATFGSTEQQTHQHPSPAQQTSASGPPHVSADPTPPPSHPFHGAQ